MGKSPSGLFLFNVVWMGSFQQCIDVVAIEDDEELFKGKYCKSSILVGYSFCNTFALMCDSCVKCLLHKESQTGHFFCFKPLTIAFCFPDSCSSSDVQIVVQAGRNNNTSLRNIIRVETKKDTIGNHKGQLSCSLVRPCMENELFVSLVLADENPINQKKISPKLSPNFFHSDEKWAFEWQKYCVLDAKQCLRLILPQLSTLYQASTIRLARLALKIFPIARKISSRCE